LEDNVPQMSEFCVTTCIVVPDEIEGRSGTTVMWMAAPQPVATTPGGASKVSALAFINDFEGYVNICTSNVQQDQHVDRELLEVSCEALGSPQSDQASQSAGASQSDRASQSDQASPSDQTTQSDQALQSEQGSNSGLTAVAQRSCAWSRLRCSWYLLSVLVPLAAMVVGVVL
jgi:hypothetical protein